MKGPGSNFKVLLTGFRMDRGISSNSKLRVSVIAKTVKRSAGALDEAALFESNLRAHLKPRHREAVSTQFSLEKGPISLHSVSKLLLSLAFQSIAKEEVVVGICLSHFGNDCRNQILFMLAFALSGERKTRWGKSLETDCGKERCD